MGLTIRTFDSVFRERALAFTSSSDHFDAKIPLYVLIIRTINSTLWEKFHVSTEKCSVLQRKTIVSPKKFERFKAHRSNLEQADN